MSDLTPLEVFEEQIREFLNSYYGRATLLRQAVLVWETAEFGDDGETAGICSYVCTSGTSAAGLVGLLRVGTVQAEAGVMGWTGSEDDD